MSARTLPPRPPEPESLFEHPAFEGLYSRALCDVADRRLDERTRKAAARALAFLFREQLVDEAVATDALTAVYRSLALAAVVRTLLLGLRDALGNHDLISKWTRTIADRALREGHLPSFVSAVRILVELRDYDGTVPARWRLAILRAVGIPELAPRVLLFTRAYGHRFPEQSWPWVRQAKAGCRVAILTGRLSPARVREARES